MGLSDEVVPTKWTDRDTDIVVQSIIDDELGLKPVTKLG